MSSARDAGRGRSPVAALVLAALAVPALLTGCSHRKGTPPLEYMPNMAYSPAIKAQNEDPMHPGISAMRPPVEGTVPRGFTPYRYAVGDSLIAQFPKRDAGGSFDSKLIDIATPVSFSGFSAGTLQQFAPQLRSLGLEPRQGVSGGASASAKAASGPLQPGSMIRATAATKKHFPTGLV